MPLLNGLAITFQPMATFTVMFVSCAPAVERLAITAINEIHAPGFIWITNRRWTHIHSKASLIKVVIGKASNQGSPIFARFARSIAARLLTTRPNLKADASRSDLQQE